MEDITNTCEEKNKNVLEKNVLLLALSMGGLTPDKPNYYCYEEKVEEKQKYIFTLGSILCCQAQKECCMN